MTDHDHNEIARRLRETGTVPAPERLRGEVMDQVRAEPRLHPSRRSFFRPMLPYAAAAATLIVAVIALSHLDLGSAGSSSSAGSGGGTAAGGASAAPERSSDGRKLTPDAAARDQTEFHVSAAAAQGLTVTAGPYAQSTGRTIVIAVPPSLYANYKALLHRIEHRSGGRTVRVILRKAP